MPVKTRFQRSVPIPAVRVLTGTGLRRTHHGRGNERLTGSRRKEQSNPEMADNTTNAVRQILMNELGLTRESVREEMCRIVKDTAESYLRGDQFQKALDQILTTAIDTRLREGHYDRDMLKREVADGIQRAIMRRLDVSVTVKA